MNILANRTLEGKEEKQENIILLWAMNPEHGGDNKTMSTFD